MNLHLKRSSEVDSRFDYRPRVSVSNGRRTMLISHFYALPLQSLGIMASDDPVLDEGLEYGYQPYAASYPSDWGLWNAMAPVGPGRKTVNVCQKRKKSEQTWQDCFQLSRVNRSPPIPLLTVRTYSQLGLIIPKLSLVCPKGLFPQLISIIRWIANLRTASLNRLLHHSLGGMPSLRLFDIWMRCSWLSNAQALGKCAVTRIHYWNSSSAW